MGRFKLSQTRRFRTSHPQAAFWTHQVRKSFLTLAKPRIPFRGTSPRPTLRGCTRRRRVLGAVRGIGHVGIDDLSRSNLVRRRSGPGFVVSVDVPASAIAVGDYELALKGITADRTSQDIGYYYFGVQRR